MADKHIIPTGKLHSNCRLLLAHIVCKITQRNIMWRVNTCDPALKLLNEEIHKHNLWKEHLDAHWDHTHNTHYGRPYISNRAPPSHSNNSITFNNKITIPPKNIANCYPNYSQTQADRQPTRQTDVLTEHHKNPVDITLHFPNSGPRGNKTKQKY